jgi:hypothetical protein
LLFSRPPLLFPRPSVKSSETLKQFIVIYQIKIFTSKRTNNFSGSPAMPSFLA